MNKDWFETYPIKHDKVPKPKPNYKALERIQKVKEQQAQREKHTKLNKKIYEHNLQVKSKILGDRRTYQLLKDYGDAAIRNKLKNL